MLATQIIQNAGDGCFVGKIDRGNPCLCKIFSIPKKKLFTTLSSLEIKK